MPVLPEAELSETDSFIEEVTEEVRRDKLYALFRKYGWIAGLLVVLVVGGAAYNEWRKATERANAEALGDAVLKAVESPDAAARASALSAIAPKKPDAKVFLELFEAAARAEADDLPAALALLDQVASNPEAPETYRQLAVLKAVILRGSDQDRDDRMAALELLATPGRPFRVVALEQIALVHYEFGNNDEAIGVLRTILEEPAATQGLLQRAQQLIVALGGTISDEEAGADTDG